MCNRKPLEKVLRNPRICNFQIFRRLQGRCFHGFSFKMGCADNINCVLLHVRGCSNRTFFNGTGGKMAALRLQLVAAEVVAARAGAQGQGPALGGPKVLEQALVQG